MSLLLLILPALIVVLYGNAIHAPFFFDDHIQILQAQAVTAFRSPFDVSAIRGVFTTSSGLANRPLLMLTYGMNYGGAGANPASFRWVNLAIHAIDSILVFFIVFELGSLTALGVTHRFQLAFLAAAIFAAHPLLTEAVTYISGRSSSLCATFYFSGLYAVLRAGRVLPRQRWALLLLSIVCAGVGWFIKQEVITLPAAAVAMIWLTWPRDVPSKTRWAATALLVSSIVLLLILQIKPVAQVTATTQGNDALVAAGFESTTPFAPFVLTSIKEYGGYYLWRMFLPISLSVDPDTATIATPLSAGFLVSAVLLLCLAFSIFWYRRRRPFLAAGLSLLLVSPLSAYCVFPLADVVAEHRAYISALGAVIIIADALFSVPRAWLFSVCVLCVFGWLTIERNALWNDEVLLWKGASLKAPNKIRPHLNLGALYQLRGQRDSAIKEYQLVLDRDPTHSSALSNLASIYLANDDLAKADELLEPAVARNSPFAAVYVNLAVVRLRQQRFDDARRLLQHAESLDPQQFMVHHDLGDILFNEGRQAQAIDEYLAELKLHPDSTLTHLHLAYAYEDTGLRDKSIEQYLIVAKSDPTNPDVRTALQRLK